MWVPFISYNSNLTFWISLIKKISSDKKGHPYLGHWLMSSKSVELFLASNWATDVKARLPDHSLTFIKKKKKKKLLNTKHYFAKYDITCLILCMLINKTSDSSLLSIYRDLFKRSLKMISILRTKWLYMDRKTSRKLLENVSGYREVNKHILFDKIKDLCYCNFVLDT